MHFLRKTAASVLAAFLLLTLVLPGYAAWGLVDGAPAGQITLKGDNALHAKFMDGGANGLFRPDAPTTRAELAQILFNLLDWYPTPDAIPYFSDVPQDAWFAPAVEVMTGLGVMTAGEDGLFHPDDPISRGEVAAVLYRLLGGGDSPVRARFPDVPEDHPARVQIGWAADRGLFQGDGMGNFNPEGGLTRAQTAAVINRLMGRAPGTPEQLAASWLRVFPDVPVGHWAYSHIMEATMAHTQESGPDGTEAWTTTARERNSLANGFYSFDGKLYYVYDGCFAYNGGYSGVTFDRNGCVSMTPGFHNVDGTIYYADRYGKLLMNTGFGAYHADAAGAVTQTSAAYHIPSVPYLSQIDGINAWVGCEAAAALPGLWVKGFAQDVTLRYYLDNLPRSQSDPELGFVGSPYVPDRAKRTTIYPAKLAEYSNSFCGGAVVCTDFRGASVEELRRELLAGNCVVAYETLWWKRPSYGVYNIAGTSQRLVNNNHAVLVCGFDPEKGYFISDPYNYYNRGQVHQYWENAQTFDSIWNERKVGMLIR
jgi:uncharacterized protein YvpB